MPARGGCAVSRAGAAPAAANAQAIEAEFLRKQKLERKARFLPPAKMRPYHASDRKKTVWLFEVKPFRYTVNMNQTVTIEIIDAAALRLLRDLAGLSLIRFARDEVSEDDTTARLNEVYKREDSSLDKALMLAQSETMDGEDW
jgi:hypothetical protein